MKNIKKVSIISKYFYPVGAGIETNILETYKKLATNNNWDITVYCCNDSLTEKNVYKNNEIYQNIKIVRQAFKWYGYFPHINIKNTDVVCLHNFNIVPHLYVLIYSLVLKILGKKKFVLILTPHGGFTPEWRIFSVPIAFIKKLFHFTIGTFLINITVDGVRAVSEWEKKEMIKRNINPAKIQVITNGLEDEAFIDVDKKASTDTKNKVKSFGRYIVQVGRIYMIKNYETTIRALALLPKDVTYVIAGQHQGDNTYINSLKALSKELNIEDRVKFIGVIKGVDKYYLIKHAQMMVHMALWESFCNVVHEGMSQGLVCIVANNSALPYLIKEKVNGYLIETKDFKTLSEKIIYVLNHKDSEEIKNIIKTNKALGLDESWENVSQKMFDFYNSLYKNINKFTYD